MPHRIIGIICTSPGWGGLELNTLRLSQWLREAGWKVHLLTAGGIPLQQYAADAPSSLNVFSEEGLPGKSGQLRVIYAWVRRYKIRVFFVPYNKDIAAASLYKRFYNRDIGFVYQQHMQVGVRKRDLIHTLRYAMIDAWIAPLQYLKEETLRLTRVPEEKIHVIPFGIEIGQFLNTPWTRESARATLSLPQDAFIVGLLGRLDPGKGQDVVIRALQQLRSDNRDYHVLVMGSATRNDAGEEFERTLQSFVAENALQHVVHFRPFSEDVMCFFRAVDVFAMPAPGETFGMVTVEAMAAGVPVIGANKDGTRELLGERRNGWLFERGDANDFCRQLSDMLASSDLEQKVALAREEAITKYSHHKMVADLAAIMEELILAQDTE